MALNSQERKPADLDYSLHYSRWHNETPEHAQLQSQRCNELFGSYLPTATSDPVLDVGCGMGFAMRMLIQRGFTEVEGIDISSQQVERCKQAGLNARVEPDTVAFLDARPGRYGVVIMLDVLEHIPVSDQIVVLRSIYNSLRPGGRLILSTPNATSIVAFRWRNIDYTHVASFTEYSLEFLLLNAGFERVAIDSSDPAVSLRRYINPVNVWKVISMASERRRFKLACVRWVWRQVLSAELPGDPAILPLGRNLHAVAYKP